MDHLKANARKLINEFKGDDFIYGTGCLNRAGEIIAPFGSKVLLISNLEKRDPENYKTILRSIHDHSIQVIGHTPSSRPNSPREDVLRMKHSIQETNPDGILVVSGGSGIDAAKAAIVLADLGGDFDDYFGTGKVTDKIRKTEKKPRPCIAIQTASGSAAHLSKYSNITDLKTNQKKLIVDDAIIPPKSLFDYSLTRTMSLNFTCDGTFDTLAHLLEVYYSAGADTIDKLEEIALTGIELILASLEKSLADPSDLAAREALGLAADLGGYAVMIGGTNGAHLTSFSLVDILSHGRACAILNPFYTVFFAPAIQRHLKKLTALFSSYKLIDQKAAALIGRKLGTAVAEGLVSFSRQVKFPTSLKEINGMTDAHINKALEAAKNPQLEMKLKNMPVPLSAKHVDEYMEPILQAAKWGDFSLIKSFDK